MKAASEAGVKGEKQHFSQRSSLLPSLWSSRQDFGMETSAQTHPSPRHGQAVGEGTQKPAAPRRIEMAWAEPPAHHKQPPAPQNWQAAPSRRPGLQNPYRQSCWLDADLPPGCLCPPVPARTSLAHPFAGSERQLHQQGKKIIKKSKRIPCQINVLK